jgi:hypothetical protein
MTDAIECLECKYPLVGVQGACCPECGRGFDLRDPATFGPRPLAGVDRVATVLAGSVVISPLTWLSLMVLGVMLIIAMPPNPQYGSRWAFFTSFLLLTISGGYVASLICAAASHAYLSMRDLPSPAVSRVWFVLPVAVVLYAVMNHFLGLPGLEWVGL